MALETRRINTCDICQKEIRSEWYVDAMPYGRTFHTSCWDAINGDGFLKILGIDDIKRVHNG